jgi:hypothetical protein
VDPPGHRGERVLLGSGCFTRHSPTDNARRELDDVLRCGVMIPWGFSLSCTSFEANGPKGPDLEEEAQPDTDFGVR